MPSIHEATTKWIFTTVAVELLAGMDILVVLKVILVQVVQLVQIYLTVKLVPHAPMNREHQAVNCQCSASTIFVCRVDRRR